MKLSAQQEKRLIGRLLSACGLNSADADTIASVVCYADMTGVYSHGLSRLIRYVRQFKSGALNPDPQFTYKTDTGPVILCDCNNASGLVAINRAYEKALPRAKEYGVCVFAGADSANLGCGGFYARRAAEDGLLMLLMSNTYPCMAPFGGTELMMGTNPIIMAAPGEKDVPVLLDVSTSQVAMGKISVFRREHKPLPDGWANDIDGKPTNDPEKAYAVTPMGGHKGYGLSMFADILSAVLTGSSFLTQIPPVEELKPENTGFIMILLDIEKFLPLPEFKARMGEYSSMIKNSRRREGVKEIILPGEPEHVKYAESLKNGIEISEALLKELDALTQELGLGTSAMALTE